MYNLNTEKQEKQELLSSLKAGQGQEISKHKAFYEPTFPCKLNDHQFYVANLITEVTEEDLKSYFDLLGTVIDVFIVIEKLQRSAFITFSHFHNLWPGKTHKIQTKHGLTQVDIGHLHGHCHDNLLTSIVIIGDMEKLSGNSIREYLYNFGSDSIVDFRRTLNSINNDFSRFVFIHIKEPEMVEEILKVTNHVIDDVQVDIFRFEY